MSHRRLPEDKTVRLLRRRRAPSVLAGVSVAAADRQPLGPGVPSSPRGRMRAVLGLALWIAVVVCGSVVLGTAALLAVARVTVSPAAFLPAGLLTLAGGAVLGARWLARGVISPRRRGRSQGRGGVLAAAVAVTLIAAPALSAVIPTGSGRPAAAVPGQSYWHLATGSTIRHVRIPALGQARPDPVIFLHGGPGTPDLAGESAYFGQLAADGFDVYVYDEFGAGGSNRAADPRDYTLARDVVDLEQIRRTIAVERVILIGHSYGANIAAGYLAEYPQHVARVVFSSPGSLDPADSSGGNLTSRLDKGRLLRLYARVLRPRSLLGYTLLQVNPDAAHRLAGDGEMDARNDAVYALSEPALHCAGHAEPHPPTGTGFYRLQYPQSATAPPAADLRTRLAGNSTPALVIKGACDYQSWASAITYRRSLPGSRLVYLHGGHNAYQDVPEPFLVTVRAFITGTALPVTPLRTNHVPPDYQGPL